MQIKSAVEIAPHTHPETGTQTFGVCLKSKVGGIGHPTEGEELLFTVGRSRIEALSRAARKAERIARDCIEARDREETRIALG